MPKLKDEVRSDRQSAILDAAERCFARKGFHATSMQEICREAGMSPGNLYRYFPSKEAMIEGICVRDMAETIESFTAVVGADNIVEAFSALGEKELLSRSRPDLALWLEMRIESTRNPHIAASVSRTQTTLRHLFRTVIDTARHRGQIAPLLPTDMLVDTLLTVSDGIIVRRVSDPHFDAHANMVSIKSFLALLMQGGAQSSTSPVPDPEPLHV